MITTLDKATNTFGFENPITIAIAYLEEQGETQLAENLYEECATMVYDDDYETDVDECGFDPYEGCYTYDC